MKGLVVMENIQTLLTMAAIGGLIGYLTNKIAVKMLFRPYKRWNFGIIKIQGVLPKRQADIAKSVGETVEHSLLNNADLYERILGESSREHLKTTLGEALAKKIHRFVPSFFRTMLGSDFDRMIMQFLDSEGDNLINMMLEHIKENAENELNVKELIEERINALDLHELEQMVKDLTKKELRHIETIGLVLGLIIGVTQFFIVSLL